MLACTLKVASSPVQHPAFSTYAREKREGLVSASEPTSRPRPVLKWNSSCSRLSFHLQAFVFMPLLSLQWSLTLHLLWVAALWKSLTSPTLNFYPSYYVPDIYHDRSRRGRGGVWARDYIERIALTFDTVPPILSGLARCIRWKSRVWPGDEPESTLKAHNLCVPAVRPYFFRWFIVSHQCKYLAGVRVFTNVPALSI